MRAYISNGTISRSKLSPRTQEDIFSRYFLAVNLASNRSASESRDYIFATMPQFPWYHYPEAAEHMHSNTVFVDFHKQASRAGRAIACRITRPMTDPKDCHDAEEVWHPSWRLPEPTCLGGFLKLLGQRLPADKSLDNYHFIAPMAVSTLSAVRPVDTFELVESAMRFSPRLWPECHRGGELAKYGCAPEVHSKPEMIQKASEPWKCPNPAFDCLTEQREAKIAELQALLREEQNTREQDGWLLPESRKILDMMWCTVDEFSVNIPIRSDWNFFKRRMKTESSAQLLERVVLLASWAQEHFIPVFVRFTKISVLGLLARHACSKGILSAQPMMCIGRHTAGEPLGKDLVIADPLSKIPVGLIPDFLYHQRTGQEFVERISALYGDLDPYVTPSGARFCRVPLDVVTMCRTR